MLKVTVGMQVTALGLCGVLLTVGQERLIVEIYWRK